MVREAWSQYTSFGMDSGGVVQDWTLQVQYFIARYFLVTHLETRENSDFITVQDRRIPRYLITGDPDSW